MKSVKASFVIFTVVGLMFLAACSNTTEATNSTERTAPESGSETTAKADFHPSQGGQVVESGSYHLEFVSEKETNGTHLDFYLQRGDTHEAIPNANITAQVQLPDGTKKTLPLTYDAQGKHYTALLPGNATGRYQVKITSDINGEKVDGRFTFNQ